MNPIISHRVGRVLGSGLLVAAACCLLSGCFSSVLALSSNGGTTKQTWGKDQIQGLSLAENSLGEKGSVFAGQNFDYLLTKGGDNIVSLLTDDNIHHQQLSVTEPGIFTINKDKKMFYGSLQLKYLVQGDDDQQQIEKYGFSCAAKVCHRALSGLEGSIHKKSGQQDPGKILKFDHPFDVNFVEYKYSSNHGRLVLLPVTIALDIVTSPLQLIVFSRN